ncbi:two-component sensor histidine kinase [Desulfosarcina ovata subsp. sediminis]|uniref:histidine kinase n=2 Tax=Desulfosarcina ovata TaxID=83564 RepID=A0A5K8A043_9BACT|nr:two-component sensor histidine kinase [Desulfosarcina ovata subsp. sediminis]
MRINLSLKLFAAFFLILAITVGAMALSRHLFAVNFKIYFNQIEKNKLERLTPKLKAAYQHHNTWADVASNAQYWQKLMHEDFNLHESPPPPLRNNFPSEKFHMQNDPAPPPVPIPGGPPMVLLSDAKLKPLIGNPGPDDNRQLVSIEVDGQVVGWLGLHRHEPFKSGPPAALLARNTRQFYLLGGAVIGLTGLIAFLFSRHLINPIQRLTRVTRELAQRNFAVRIASTTGDELGQLAKNFNIMAQTLEDYEKMRLQWLTDISHELRTPLSVLRGEIEAIQDGIREPTPQNLASLYAETLRLNKLVEDLHLLSMADSDRLQLSRQPVSPCRVIETIMETYRDRFERSQLEIEWEPGPDADSAYIQGDADRLAQVFTNLLDNALKYVKAPGQVRISGQADGQWLTVTFQDSGPGVPEDALPRLFDRLYRVDPSRNRDTGGSGLGLSICRNIIKNHEGRIWAEQSPLGGLAIGISLPLASQ